MADVIYPATLPGPMPGSFAPRPRRAASPLEGPLQQRARQRDAAGMVSQYTYVYTPDEMADWLAWYRDTLRDGRRWFAHALPGRGGLVTRVVRYLEVQQQLLGAGIYRVNATFEQRGASVAPQDDGDPFWGAVLLLVDGRDSFLDQSANGYTLYPSEGLLADNDELLFGLPTFGLTGLEWTRRLSIDLASKNAIVAAVGAGEYTLETWVKPVTSSDDGRFMLCAGWYANFTADGKLSMVDQAAATVITADAVAPGEWHHMALCRDNSAALQDHYHFRVNGVLIETELVAPKGIAHTDPTGGLAVMEDYGLLGRVGSVRLTAANRYGSGPTNDVPSGPYPVA